jgi:hypothetical protein
MNAGTKFPGRVAGNKKSYHRATGNFSWLLIPAGRIILKYRQSSEISCPILSGPYPAQKGG